MFSVNPWTIIVIAIISVICLVFVVIWSVRAHQKQVSAGREELIGKAAIVETVLKPKGTVLIQGERWTATLDKGRIEPEEEVIITKVDGLKLQVTKKE